VGHVCDSGSGGRVGVDAGAGAAGGGVDLIVNDGCHSGSGGIDAGVRVDGGSGARAGAGAAGGGVVLFVNPLLLIAGNRFQQFVSDRISLHRPLRDPRSHFCRENHARLQVCVYVCVCVCVCVCVRAFRIRAH
jgi:hypothetical protein